MIFAFIGQQINLTLFDFGIWTRHASDETATFCDSYAVVRGDPSSQQTICGGDERVKGVYISNSNSIEIVMSRQLQGYLIQFKSMYSIFFTDTLSMFLFILTFHCKKEKRRSIFIF